MITIDPENADTDYDGLDDGVEIDTELQYKNSPVYNTSGEIIHVAGYYYHMNSDPNMEDTDGDGYDDADEYLYGSNPTFNSVVLIAKIDDDNYVRVENPSTEDNANQKDFGGYQGWFEGEYTDMSGLGCGVIASCDVLIYMYQHNMIPYNIYYPEKTQGVPQNNPLFTNIPRTGSIPYDAYYDFVMYYHDNYFSVRTSWETRGTRLANMLEGFLRNNEVKSTVKWSDGSLNSIYLTIVSGVENELFHTEYNANNYEVRGEEEIALSIIESLYKNIPVIISSGPYSKDIDMYSSDKLYLDKSDDVDVQSFDNHYATITAIYYNDVFKSYVLEMSSWGNKYYMNFEQYCNNKDVYSDVFSIKLNGYYHGL